MEANLTPEERLRLEVQVRKARRLQADEARRKALAERKEELATGARFVAMFPDGREGERYVSRYGGQPIWDRDRAAVHADRQCQAIKGMQGTEVRDATPEEVANMEPCGHRVCRIARGRTSKTPGPSAWRSRRATRCGRCPAVPSRAIAGGTRCPATEREKRSVSPSRMPSRGSGESGSRSWTRLDASSAWPKAKRQEQSGPLPGAPAGRPDLSEFRKKGGPARIVSGGALESNRRRH